MHNDIEYIVWLEIEKQDYDKLETKGIRQPKAIATFTTQKEAENFFDNILLKIGI